MSRQLRAILDRLRGVRGEGNQWKALCPAHADKNPSLSLREGNGKVLLHCFAGCAVESICAALGIKISDLFTEPREPRKREPGIVRAMQREIAGLRSRLTPADRERAVTVITTNRENVDLGIARALALAVEGELAQVALREGRE
jgi:hypothetical protein